MASGLGTSACFVFAACLSSSWATELHALKASDTIPPTRVVLVIPNSTGPSDPNKAIEDLAKQEADFFKTYGKLLDGASALLGKIASGQSVDWGELALKYVPEFLGLMDPFLGGAASIVTSFLGGLFGSLDVNAAIYDAIQKIVPDMINKAFIAEQMAEIRGDILDLLDERFWSNILEGESKIAQRRSYLQNLEASFNNMKRKVFNVDCFDTTGDNEKCRTWQEAGAIIHELNFMHLHIQTFLANAVAWQGDNATVKGILDQMTTIGWKYAAAANGAWSQFKTYRLSEAGPSFGEKDPTMLAMCTLTVSDMLDKFTGEDVLTTCGLKMPGPPYTGRGVCLHGPRVCQQSGNCLQQCGQECEMMEPIKATESLVNECWNRRNEKVTAQFDHWNVLLKKFYDLLGNAQKVSRLLSVASPVSDDASTQLI